MRTIIFKLWLSAFLAVRGISALAAAGFLLASCSEADMLGGVIISLGVFFVVKWIYRWGLWLVRPEPQEPEVLPPG